MSFASSSDSVIKFLEHWDTSFYETYTLPAFCIFDSFRVLSAFTSSRVRKPFLYHFSDVFTPTPKTEVNC